MGGPEMAPHTPQLFGATPAEPGRSSVTVVLPRYSGWWLDRVSPPPPWSLGGTPERSDGVAPQPPWSLRVTAERSDRVSPQPPWSLRATPGGDRTGCCLDRRGRCARLRGSVGLGVA